MYIFHLRSNRPTVTQRWLKHEPDEQNFPPTFTSSRSFFTDEGCSFTNNLDVCCINKRDTNLRRSNMSSKIDSLPTMESPWIKRPTNYDCPKLHDTSQIFCEKVTRIYVNEQGLNKRSWKRQFCALSACEFPYYCLHKALRATVFARTLPANPLRRFHQEVLHTAQEEMYRGFHRDATNKVGKCLVRLAISTIATDLQWRAGKQYTCSAAWVNHSTNIFPKRPLPSGHWLMRSAKTRTDSTLDTDFDGARENNS